MNCVALFCLLVMGIGVPVVLAVKFLPQDILVYGIIALVIGAIVYREIDDNYIIKIEKRR